MQVWLEVAARGCSQRSSASAAEVTPICAPCSPSHAQNCLGCLCMFREACSRPHSDSGAHATSRARAKPFDLSALLHVSRTPGQDLDSKGHSEEQIHAHPCTLPIESGKRQCRMSVGGWLSPVLARPLLLCPTFPGPMLNTSYSILFCGVYAIGTRVSGGTQA